MVEVYFTSYGNTSPNEDHAKKFAGRDGKALSVNLSVGGLDRTLLRVGAGNNKISTPGVCGKGWMLDRG